MTSQTNELKVELPNSQYGSLNTSKPLISQKGYTQSVSMQSQPFSEVKYESLNEIHLDFSHAKPYQGGLRSLNKSIGNSETSTPDLPSPTLTTSNPTSNPNSNSNQNHSVADRPNSITNKNHYLNSLHSHPSMTSENSNPLSYEGMKRKGRPPVFVDTSLKNSLNTSFTSSANTTFTAVNNTTNTAATTPLTSSNSTHTPSTDATLESPFFFRNFENTPTPTPISNTSSTSSPFTLHPSKLEGHDGHGPTFNSVVSPIPKSKPSALQEPLEPSTPISSILETPGLKTTHHKNITILDTTPDRTSKSNTSSPLSKTPTPNFKSFKSFDRLKSQLESDTGKESDHHPSWFSREQLIHQQFSEQFRKDEVDFNQKKDPFYPRHATPPTTSPHFQEDPFLLPENNEPLPDSSNDLLDFDQFKTTKEKKINWTIKTDSEKYISRLESKINKIKKTPKEIVVEIPEDDDFNDDYDSIPPNEETELLSDSESINQPLIRQSDEGTRIRRRKQIIYTLRDNKKLLVTLLVFFCFVISAILLYL